MDGMDELEKTVDMMGKTLDKILENFKRINEIFQIVNDKINMLNDRVNDLEGNSSMNLNNRLNEGIDSALASRLEVLAQDFKRFEEYLNKYIKGSNEKYYEEFNNFIDKFSDRRGAKYEGRFIKRYLYNSGNKDGWEKLNDSETGVIISELIDYMRDVEDKILDMVKSNKRK